MTSPADGSASALRHHPVDHDLRMPLQAEIHARPSPRIRMPALVVCIAVDNTGVDPQQELECLRRLPGAQDLRLDQLDSNFLRLRIDKASLRWERHTEFTRYTLVQALPACAWPATDPLPMTRDLVLPSEWLATLPGRTLVALKLVMIERELSDPRAAVAEARDWFSGRTVVASRIGNDGHSCAVSDLHIGTSGFERFVVLCSPGTSESRAGRVAQRLIELKIYSVLALRGLPAAKALAPALRAVETDLARAVADLERGSGGDKKLLHDLTSLAARLERATAEHGWRFSATSAYDTLVQQRIAELRERPVLGTQTFGEYLQRRLSPAMATVASAARRLDSLAARVERSTALLRTRVDIATEEQNHALLSQLTRGQALQLRLQATVEGLSIAAISYYIVSLLLYAGKAAKSAGLLPVEPELAAGVLIPAVVWAVWRGTRRIHGSLTISPVQNDALPAGKSNP